MKIIEKIEWERVDRSGFALEKSEVERYSVFANTVLGCYLQVYKMRDKNSYRIVIWKVRPSHGQLMTIVKGYKKTSDYAVFEHEYFGDHSVVMLAEIAETEYFKYTKKLFSKIFE